MAEAFSLLYIEGDRALGFLERGQRRSLVVREGDLGGRVGGQDSLTNTVPFEKWKGDPYSKTKPQPCVAPVAKSIGLQLQLLPSGPVAGRVQRLQRRREPPPRALRIRRLPRPAAGAAA